MKSMQKRSKIWIERYGTLDRVSAPFLLCTDNGLIFTSRQCLVRSSGLPKEFITPYCLE